MFVSSYNTYINANNFEKTRKSNLEESKKTPESFSTKLLSQAVKSVNVSSSFPINYISNYKALNNQQRLQENRQKLQDNRQNEAKNSFSKIKTLTNANKAYIESSKFSPILVKTVLTIDQTPKIKKDMPKKAQEAKEQIMKHTMVNTYIANDNYYKLTA